MKDACVKFSNYYWCLLVIENGHTRPSQQKLAYIYAQNLKKCVLKPSNPRKNYVKKMQSLL